MYDYNLKYYFEKDHEIKVKHLIKTGILTKKGQIKSGRKIIEYRNDYNSPINQGHFLKSVQITKGKQKK